MRTKRQKRVVGDIVQIPLGDGTHTYARLLPEGSFAFYDSRSSVEIEIANVVKLPILFFIAVSMQAMRDRRWRVIGHVPLDDGLRTPAMFIQDAYDPDSFSLYKEGQIIPATRQECVGLERMAVWEPEHVENRLRDHYAGRKNKEFESLKMR
jgi:hypothetical protein